MENIKCKQMTEEQYKTIEKICDIAEFIGNNARDLFYSERQYNDFIEKMLSDGIHNLLNEVGFKNCLAWNTSNLDNDTTFCIDIDYEDYEDYENAIDEARDRALDKVFNFVQNALNDIENFLDSVDKEYDTDFCTHFYVDDM